VKENGNVEIGVRMVIEIKPAGRWINLSSSSRCMYVTSVVFVVVVVAAVDRFENPSMT
jgi:hypothetical protein